MTAILAKIYLFLLILPVSVGNFTDYSGGGGGGGGGGTDFGGGGDFSGSYDGDSGSGGGMSPQMILLSVAIILLIILWTNRKRKKPNRSFGNTAPRRNTINLDVPVHNNSAILAKIKDHDEAFSSESFLSWAETVFIQLQEAWTERDWKKARPFESEELFNLHKSQLDEYIRNGTINVMENVGVNQSFYLDYKTENDKEYVTVFMQVHYNDYIIKEDTKELVRGNKERTYYANYKLKFMRTLGVTTGKFSNKSTQNCPNCGAPVDINAAGQCAYCGTVITTGEHDWVLCGLDIIAQA